MQICYLGLGSNIGNNQKNIDQAIHLIKSTKGIKYIRKAKYYKTKAWGKTDQNDFLNTVIEIKTKVKPIRLLEQMQRIEAQMGRIKKEKWGERNIDIDILLYGQMEIKQDHLQIPHPFMTQRSFVLAPLYELNPHLNLVNLGKLSDFMNFDLINKEILKIY